MNKKIISAVALATVGALGLSACYEDGYGYSSVGVGWGVPYVYNGWYDGYYGNIYDGYWGGDGYFYYRPGPDIYTYRRADRGHFMREAPRNPGGNWHEWRGEVRPQQHYTMPHFQGGQPGAGSRGEGRGGGRGEGHGGGHGRR